MLWFTCGCPGPIAMLLDLLDWSVAFVLGRWWLTVAEISVPLSDRGTCGYQVGSSLLSLESFLILWYLLLSLDGHSCWVITRAAQLYKQIDVVIRDDGGRLYDRGKANLSPLCNGPWTLFIWFKGVASLCSGVYSRLMYRSLLSYIFIAYKLFLIFYCLLLVFELWNVFLILIYSTAFLNLMSQLYWTKSAGRELFYAKLYTFVVSTGFLWVNLTVLLAV